MSMLTTLCNTLLVLALHFLACESTATSSTPPASINNNNNSNNTIQTLPKRQIGMYLLLSDDTVPNYTSTDVWSPSLYPYQQSGVNVVYLTFINPTYMSVPPAFATLSNKLRRNTKRDNTIRPTILFALGGYSYSNHPNPWPWLTSQVSAENMAKVVSQWPDLFGCDGVDLDIETGAGSSVVAAENLIHFVKKLNILQPKMLVTQPVFGYPQVKAESSMVNSAFNRNVTASDRPALDAVGIMVYSGTNSLQYLKNYVNGSQQWEGFPIHVDVPASKVVCGMGGNAAPADLNKFVANALSGHSKGVMVWYGSVLDDSTNQTAIQYAGGGPDASNKKTRSMWEAALKKLKN